MGFPETIQISKGFAPHQETDTDVEFDSVPFVTPLGGYPR